MVMARAPGDLFRDAINHIQQPSECLLLAQNGHSDCRNECPLLGVKRTSKFKSVTSAFDPKRTSAAEAAQVLGLFKNSNYRRGAEIL